MIKTEFICNASRCLGGEVYLRELDDFQEAIDIANRTASLEGSERLRRASLVNTHSFTGTYSMNETVDLARYGWSEGREKIAEALAEISTRPLIGNSLRPEPFFDVTGDEVDVSRYLSGEPEAMVDYNLPPAGLGNVVELVVNCSQSSSTSKETIIKRGAALVAAVERLTTDGYSIGVSVAEAVRAEFYKAKTEYLIPVLKPGESLDIDALAFTLAHPSFLRRMIFAVQELEPSSLRNRMGFKSGGGYGLPDPLEHIPPVDHTRIIIQNDQGMNGGPAAAQEIIDGVLAAVESQNDN